MTRRMIIGLLAVLTCSPALARDPAPVSGGNSVRPPFEQPWVQDATPSWSVDEEPIGLGLNSFEVTDMQRRLTQLGYDAGPLNGRAGQQTRRAIWRWQFDTGQVPTGEVNPQVLAMLQAAVPSITDPLELPPAQDSASLQQELIGRPIIGTGGDLVGHVSGVATDRGGQINSVMARLGEGAGERVVPLPWEWVSAQLRNPQIRIPLTAAGLVWLTQGQGPRQTLAGRKSSWLDGAQATTADGNAFGSVDGFLFNADGEVAAIMVRRGPNGPDFAVPRAKVRVVDPAHVSLDMSAGEVLALSPFPAGGNAPIAETPQR